MRNKRIPLLERRFGVFWCDCGNSWSSAHVYCVRGTPKVYFKQKCEVCKTAQFPSNTWELRCGECHENRWNCDCICEYCGEYRTDCKCHLKDSDRDKSHRKHLCMKCLAGMPCV